MKSLPSHSYCLKEAIEKDEDLQPWDAETKTWVVPPSLTGLATSSEGPPRASGDEETKTSEAKTKLPREGLLRPGLTCPRSRGEEIREKCVKSKTRPGKRQSVLFSHARASGHREQYFGSRKLKTDANKTNSKRGRKHTINRPKKTARFRTHTVGRYQPLERKIHKVLFSWNVSRVKKNSPPKTPFPQVQGQPTQG